MKNYYRVMLGRGSVHASECFPENFIGVDFDIHQDLTGKLSEDWRAFNKEFIPVFLADHPDKSKIGAGLRCGSLWTVAKGIKIGDSVICADGSGRYRVGEITGDYFYQPDGVLPHRRSVRWLSQIIDRTDMSKELRNATGAPGTVSNVTGYHDEIKRLIGGPTVVPPDETAAFVMEKHLEDFLVQTPGSYNPNRRTRQ